MSGDSTVQSFPTYAELTQTAGWAATQPSSVAPGSASISGPRYTEGQVLGVGGMGKVVLARDARIGRDVAVKVLHAERELAPEERARFLREAQVQGQLEHPSIVPVYDIDERPDGSTFFTMRRVLGRTLGAILDELRAGVPAAKARYTQRELLTAFATVCLTIDYAHSRGVIHRDLKPANIMLGDFGEVYVLDWGLARIFEPSARAVTPIPISRLSSPGDMMGTPLYMAPEQMGDPDVGPAADVFSLGAILFEILTLQRARDPSALFAPVDARPSVRAPDLRIAPELEAICVKATADEPADRYPTPRALQEAIARYLEGDRELEQHRALATRHVQSARDALARSTRSDADFEAERGTAITELGRAVALDPGNGENLAMLAELMSAEPARIPREVAEQIERGNQQVIRDGAKHAVGAITSWWLFLPLLLWIGFHDVSQLPYIAVPVVLTMLVGIALVRRRTPIGRTSQYMIMIATLAASIGLGRIFGPFVLVPPLITAYAVVLQAHPWRDLRVAGAVISAIAITLPAILEWFGVLPRSHRFEDGTWTIVPQLLELPELGTNVFLVIANLASIIIPCLFIARLRAELGRAQVRLAVQAWHWKQLGARLIGASA